MAIRVKYLFILISSGLFFSLAAFSQNAERLKEEDVKEQERISKYQEYLKQREEEEKALLEKPVTIEELETKNLVEVEPNNILPSDLVSTYALVPYRVRRPRWGHMFNATASLYHPLNYQSDYSAANYDETYGRAKTPMIELSYTYKWNFIMGSVGGELSYGMYTNEAKDAAAGDAKLDLRIARAGLKYIADNMFYEPIWAPYFFGGAYSVMYKETQTAALALDGSTAVGFYYGGGVMFQLGWIDPSAAVDAYTESGIENTYLFAEARQFLESTDESDPDFSTDLDFNVGISIEF